MTTETKTTTCYGRFDSVANNCQAWYETATRDAGRRAKQLRALGFSVSVSPMGPQVTGVGVVKMTLVTVDGMTSVPQPERTVRL